LALQLAKVGLSLPHGDKKDLTNELLRLSMPILAKRELLTVLVLDGDIIPADMPMEAVKSWIEAAKKERWRQEQRQWELEEWLALLVFSDRPSSLLAALDLAEGVARPLREMQALLTALQNAPDTEAETILAGLARQDPRLLTDHTWLQALLFRETPTAPFLLLDLLSDRALATHAGRVDVWWISEKLADLTLSQPRFRDELLERYENAEMAPCHDLIEQVLAKAPDARSILAMLRRYVATGESFDYTLRSAIEHVVLERRPVSSWHNAYELHSADSSELRKQLFAMVATEGAESAIAASCLKAIDRLRDEYGHPDLEPRHPDIETGCAWPHVLAS
jgi:hypothetical protein